MSDLCSTFLNLTKKYLSFVAEGPYSIDVPNDQVQRGHNFSPHGNVNFIAKGSVKQHQEDMKDLNHKHEPPQLKEIFSTDIPPKLGVPLNGGENVRTQGCSTYQHKTNQAVAKLGTVPGSPTQRHTDLPMQ